MRTAAKIALALTGFVAASLASLPIGTYSRIRDARKFIHGTGSVDAVAEHYGKFSHRLSEPDKLSEWRKRYSLDIREGDTLFIVNQEGFPYWIIAIVSPDYSEIRDRYVGYYK